MFSIEFGFLRFILTIHPCHQPIFHPLEYGHSKLVYLICVYIERSTTHIHVSIHLHVIVLKITCRTFLGTPPLLLLSVVCTQAEHSSSPLPQTCKKGKQASFRFEFPLILFTLCSYAVHWQFECPIHLSICL